MTFLTRPRIAGHHRLGGAGLRDRSARRHWRGRARVSRASAGRRRQRHASAAIRPAAGGRTARSPGTSPRPPAVVAKLVAARAAGSAPATPLKFATASRPPATATASGYQPVGTSPASAAGVPAGRAPACRKVDRRDRIEPAERHPQPAAGTARARSGSAPSAARCRGSAAPAIGHSATLVPSAASAISVSALSPVASTRPSGSASSAVGSAIVFARATMLQAVVGDRQRDQLAVARARHDRAARPRPSPRGTDRCRRARRAASRSSLPGRRSISATTLRAAGVDQADRIVEEVGRPAAGRRHPGDPRRRRLDAQPEARRRGRAASARRRESSAVPSHAKVTTASPTPSVAAIRLPSGDHASPAKVAGSGTSASLVAPPGRGGRSSAARSNAPGRASRRAAPCR